MKTVALSSALLAPIVAAVGGPWYGGAPECAQDCFSSYWTSSTDNWPAPTNYCGASQANDVQSCLSSACEATPTAWTSYSSLSSSLCSQWSSCTAEGSTGVYTASLPGFTGTWDGKWDKRAGPGGGGPGGWGPGDSSWGGWASDGWQGTKTWTGGVYTVTGCEWDGSPWAGGPGGWGAGGGRGGSPWGPWGKGWTWSTATTTVTQVITSVNGDITALSTSVGLATVAQAVSGDQTSTSIISGAQATSGSGSGSSAAGSGKVSEAAAGVKIMGALLAGFVGVAALL